ncbi:MAG: sensor histidine kinase [Acidobacteriota bacterium]
MPKKLAQRLILFLTLIVVVGGAVSGFFQIKTQERQLVETIIEGADQLSNGISSATWHAMLADNRESAYMIMNTIAQRQGINKIRIFNREGRVMFSTDSADTQRVSLSDPICAICHAGGKKPLVTPDQKNRAQITHNASGQRELAMVTPIYNEPACSNADCHAHPAHVKVLGMLDVVYNLENVDTVVASMQQRMILSTSLYILIIGGFIFIFVRITVHRPIAKLIDGTRAISQMQLDQPIEIASSDEIGELARSFNVMRERLMMTIGELNELTQSLETKVQKRTEQLKNVNQKLFQSDRLASLGQLSASVAHEINNPIAGVLNLSMLLQRIITERGIASERIPEVKRYLEQISGETARVGRIVQDLLAFSRRSSPQRTMADLNSIICRTVSILDHKLKLANVDLELALCAELPQIKCDTSQLQQVIVNLIMNAAESTHSKGHGTVGVRTLAGPDGESVIMEVKDNGDGIAKEHLSKIFDPFFTTKEEGKGTGLGLAVVYGIIESHGGDIEVESEPGAGTLFRVQLPRSGEAVKPESPSQLQVPGTVG